jgi:hypothetical protein
MKLFKESVAFILLVFSAFTVAAQSPAPPSQAQPPAASSPSQAAGQFVQQFYNWYLAKEKAAMNKSHSETVFELTLREKQASFSPELVKALKEDLAASKKSPEEIVGLDFDPFLNAQDMGERYIVGKVTPKGDHYWVEVFGVWGGKKNVKPDVVPELAFQNGSWIFTNFHYGNSSIPVNENLVSILQQLKKDREKPKK